MKRFLSPLLFAWLVIGWLVIVPLWLYLGAPMGSLLGELTP